MDNATVIPLLLEDSVIKELQKHEMTIILKKTLSDLEELKESIPRLIEKAILDYKKAKLVMLHEKDKKNPAGVNARVKKYNEKHKDEINAKRIMKRNQMNGNREVVSFATQENTSLITNTGLSEFTVKF
jgi:phage-related baseplate assembly protein